MLILLMVSFIDSAHAGKEIFVPDVQQLVSFVIVNPVIFEVATGRSSPLISIHLLRHVSLCSYLESHLGLCRVVLVSIYKVDTYIYILVIIPFSIYVCNNPICV